MYPRIYTFSILQTLVIPRYPIMNISYLIFSLSLFRFTILEILKILFDLIIVPVNRRKNYTFNERKFLFDIQRASPSNNFYLNKQSAIISNPTYKRTHVFLRINKLDCYPIKNWRHVRAIDSSPVPRFFPDI